MSHKESSTRHFFQQDHSGPLDFPKWFHTARRDLQRRQAKKMFAQIWYGIIISFSVLKSPLLIFLTSSPFRLLRHVNLPQGHGVIFSVLLHRAVVHRYALLIHSLAYFSDTVGLVDACLLFWVLRILVVYQQGWGCSFWLKLLAGFIGCFFNVLWKVIFKWKIVGFSNLKLRSS